MSVPNMATQTASLERSLQNCSLNHRSSSNSVGATTGLGQSATSSISDVPEINRNHNRNHRQQQQRYQQQGQQFSSSFTASSGNCTVFDNYSNHHHQYPSSSASSTTSNDSTLVELNSHISMPYQWEQCLDLKTGEVYYVNWKSGMKSKEDPRRATATTLGSYYYSSDDDDEDDEEGDDSYDSEGSSTAESSPSNSTCRDNFRISRNNNYEQLTGGGGANDVLVVAGCTRCLMYYMVPKQLEDCPKCDGQLLHFDRCSSDNSSTISTVSSSP